MTCLARAALMARADDRCMRPEVARPRVKAGAQKRLALNTCRVLRVWRWQLCIMTDTSTEVSDGGGVMMMQASTRAGGLWPARWRTCSIVKCMAMARRIETL